MKELNPHKVFVQYRDIMKPYGPVMGRFYTITHSDISAELFVFVASNYAEDQITKMRDEVRVAWEQYKEGVALIGSVIVDGSGVTGNASIRNNIFYNEMPTALQALRQADRFLFDKEPKLDNSPVFIQFISDNPEYNKIYDFGAIGIYK
ncbi:staygreen family protein [Clostridium boliviensis]|uniref:Staygreen family protein n=1 Tax=Clostridium boliviensis TaxID=318465 RepID=A0ABU4GIP2_9CLOT|nr:staygreen family protein [Clostridium boliviensis]MDW2797480.1 staygreen family protein [Clostridium boliviensis]